MSETLQHDDGRVELQPYVLNEIEGSSLYNEDPVSYTHLDVYKRQSQIEFGTRQHRDSGCDLERAI